jgi:hypothetical protein
MYLFASFSLVVSAIILPFVQGEVKCDVSSRADASPISEKGYDRLWKELHSQILVNYVESTKYGSQPGRGPEDFGFLEDGKFPHGKGGICCEGYCFGLENHGEEAREVHRDLLDAEARKMKRQCVGAWKGENGFQSKCFLAGLSSVGG